MNAARPPQTPSDRALWVRYQLGLRGLRLADLADRLGVSRQAVSQALYAPSATIEQAIAEAVGLPVEQLFADRYRPDGRRRHRVRQRTTRRPHNKVEKARAIEQRRGAI